MGYPLPSFGKASIQTKQNIFSKQPTSSQEPKEPVLMSPQKDIRKSIEGVDWAQKSIEYSTMLSYTKF